MLVLLFSHILILNWGSQRLTEGHSFAEYVNGSREDERNLGDQEKTYCNFPYQKYMS
jgi:hypothetical protein